MKQSSHNILVLSAAACISVFVFFIGKKNKTEHDYRYRTFHVLSGWGYDILVDDKLIIRQESIPVLNGSKGFLTKEQAAQTAEVIINKMENGQPPVITTFDLRLILPELNETAHAEQGKH